MDKKRKELADLTDEHFKAFELVLNQALNAETASLHTQNQIFMKEFEPERCEESPGFTWRKHPKKDVQH